MSYGFSKIFLLGYSRLSSLLRTPYGYYGTEDEGESLWVGYWVDISRTRRSIIIIVLKKVV